MSATNDGGPAFPSQTDTFRTPEGRAVGRPAESGMTLRDYFAAKALPKCVAFSRDRGMVGTAEEAARVAYQIADAMLRVREAKP